MKANNLIRTLLISIPIALVLVICSAVIGNAFVNGQSSTQFSVPVDSAEPTFSLLTSNSPTPKNSASPEPSQDPQSDTPGITGNSSNSNGSQNAPFMPNWTEAQRACQAQMQVMAAESVRLGAAHNQASNYAVSLSAELNAKYPGIPSNQWSPEDSARMDQAWAERQRTSEELSAFWAQYPWSQYGCNENGFWHVP